MENNKSKVETTERFGVHQANRLFDGHLRSEGDSLALSAAIIMVQATALYVCGISVKCFSFQQPQIPSFLFAPLLGKV